MASFRVRDTDAEGRPVTGIDYPPNRHAEPGDVLDDLPPNAAKWLAAQGYIEPAKAGRKGA